MFIFTITISIFKNTWAYVKASFSHSVTKYLLSAYSLPETVLESRDKKTHSEKEPQSNMEDKYSEQISTVQSQKGANEGI